MKMENMNFVCQYVNIDFDGRLELYANRGMVQRFRVHGFGREELRACVKI